MPAVSKAQQKLMGAALAAKEKGAKPISPEVGEIAKSMSKRELEKYAGTKHKGLPKKVKKESLEGAVTEMYAIRNPYSGCQAKQLVMPFDPLSGIPQDQMTPDDIRGVYYDREMADSIAEQLYEEHVKYEQLLEKKKDSVINRLKSTIAALEKERETTMKRVMATPNTASHHRERIARLTTKIDDLVTKLERVGKSKKQQDEEEEE